MLSIDVRGERKLPAQLPPTSLDDVPADGVKHWRASEGGRRAPAAAASSYTRTPRLIPVRAPTGPTCLHIIVYFL